MKHQTKMELLDYESDGGPGQRARIGLIVLQTDLTVEHELATLLLSDGVTLYHSRIPNAPEVTPETLRQMARELPQAAGLLPTSVKFDAIGYACTSGATMLGEARVDEMIRQSHPQARTTNPLAACKAALTALGLKRIALITPYSEDVTLALQDNLRDAGFEINAAATFNQSQDSDVARISSASILKAVAQIGARSDCDGVFVSCTSLRALPIIAQAEALLDKPVISSNQALGWHLLRLSGITTRSPGKGRLFATG